MLNYFYLLILIPVLVSAEVQDSEPVTSSKLTNDDSVVFAKKASVHHYTHSLELLIDLRLTDLQKALTDANVLAHTFPKVVETLLNETDSYTLPALQIVLGNLAGLHNNVADASAVPAQIQVDAATEASQSILMKLSTATGIPLRQKRSSSSWAHFLEHMVHPQTPAATPADDVEGISSAESFLKDPQVDEHYSLEELLNVTVQDTDFAHASYSLNTSALINRTDLFLSWFGRSSGENLAPAAPHTPAPRRHKRATSAAAQSDPVPLATLTKQQIDDQLTDHQTLSIFLNQATLAVSPVINEMLAAHQALSDLVDTGVIQDIKKGVYKLTKFVEDALETPMMNYYQTLLNALNGLKPASLVSASDLDDDLETLLNLLQHTTYRLPAQKTRAVLSYQVFVKKSKHGKLLLHIR